MLLSTVSVGTTNAWCAATNFAEFRIGIAIDEQVRESVRARRDRRSRAGEIADVDERQLSARMRRRDGRAKHLGRERRQRRSVRAAVVVHDLHIVRSFGDARVDERLRGIGRGERRNRRTVLGAVTALHGHERARREEIGARRRLSRALLGAPGARRADVAEHVELRRHAERERGRERLVPRVRVGVDEPGQQRLAGAVDHRRAPAAR